MASVMRRSWLVLALTACGSPANHAANAPAAAASGGDRAPATDTRAEVRARVPGAAPTCRAGDLEVLASLTPGVAAMAAVARGPHGGLVAFVSGRGAATSLHLLRLDARGQAVGAPTVVADAGTDPAHPAVVATAAGYGLAWRAGAPGSEAIESGTVADDEHAAPTVTARATHRIAHAWFGPPAIARDGRIAAACADEAPRDPEARTSATLCVFGPHDARIAVPPGGAFDAMHAPWLVAPSRILVRIARADATAPGDARSLVELSGDDAQARVIALDIGAVAPFETDDGLLLAWTARVASHDTAVRAYALPAHGDATRPPVTVATFRGAFGAEIGLIPVAADRIGAFTFSTLADDAGGTLNVSTVTRDGDFVARQPLLVSSLVRNARVVAAPDGHDGAWFVFEARGDGGTGPVLGLSDVTCDPARPLPAAESPTPSLVQRLASADDPPTALAGRSASAPGTCTAAGTPAFFARHASGAPDALAGTTTRVATLGQGAVLFARVRDAQHPTGALTVATVSARGLLGAARTVTLRDPDAVLAAGARSGSAIALVRVGRGEASSTARIAVGADGSARAAVMLPVMQPGSAAIAPRGEAFIVGADAHGDVSLWFDDGRSAPRVVAPLRPGDRVLDATRSAHATVALVARPDALGEEIARALALVTVPDGGPPPTRADDPFADPIAYGRGDAALFAGSPDPVVLQSEREVVRVADLSRGEVHAPRSALGTYPHGGALLARSTGDARWIAVAAGLPDGATSDRPPVIALASLDAHGAVTHVTTDLPDDAGVVPGHAALAAWNDRVVLVYARAERDGTAAWMVAQATCGGAR